MVGGARLGRRDCPQTRRERSPLGAVTMVPPGGWSLVDNKRNTHTRGLTRPDFKSGLCFSIRTQKEGYELASRIFSLSISRGADSIFRTCSKHLVPGFQIQIFQMNTSIQIVAQSSVPLEAENEGDGEWRLARACGQWGTGTCAFAGRLGRSRSRLSVELEGRDALRCGHAKE